MSLISPDADQKCPLNQILQTSSIWSASDPKNRLNKAHSSEILIKTCVVLL